MKFITKVGSLIAIILAFSFSGNYISSMKGKDAPEQEVLSPRVKTKIAKMLEPHLVNGIDSIVELYQKRYHFHGQILVNYKGHKIYNQSVGYNNPKAQEPLEGGKPFQLASVSKQFTAAAIMILEENGKLDYSQKVTDFFPDFPYKGITVRNLLNHTAGLPNYMWLIEHRWNKEEIPYNDDVIDLLSRHTFNLNFRPGTRFYYSNTGYVLLASIVEEVSGKRFGDYVDERIFEPLEMNNSFVYSAALDRDYPEKMKGYRSYGRYYRPVPENLHDGVVGDKGVYSTAEDLYKWDQALYNRTLIDEEQLKEAYDPVELENGYEINYGFGFRIQKQNGKKVIYHNGLWNGFRTSIKRHIEDTMSVIVLNNTDSRIKGQLVRSIESFLQQNSRMSRVHKLVERTLNGSPENIIEEIQRIGDKGAGKLKTNRIKKVIEYLENNKKEESAQQLTKLYKNLNRHFTKRPMDSEKSRIVKSS